MGEMPTQFPLPPTSKRAGDPASSPRVQSAVEAFRACHERYNACLSYKNLRTKSAVRETVQSYMLDFDLAAKRAIGTNSERYRLFQLHFIQGYSASEICGQLEVSRFKVASEISEIEKLAGRAFEERGLFPLSAYFGEGKTSVYERRAA